MKVILLQNIKGFGKIGEIKNVSDGHARNLLFPRKLAKPATEGAMKEAEGLSKKREAMSVKDKENAEKAAAVLKESALEFKKKASPTGTLFSSVTKHEIAHELSKKTGIKIETDSLDLGPHGEHIKHLGEHEIKIDLGNEIEAQVKIKVSSWSLTDKN